jgi:transcriptional regulator with XRE-family HTH domain
MGCKSRYRLGHASLAGVTMTDLAARVKAQRKRLGLTRRQLTERLHERGVDACRSWLRTLESGGLNARPALKLLELSRLLGVTLEWLLTGRRR